MEVRMRHVPGDAWMDYLYKRNPFLYEQYCLSTADDFAFQSHYGHMYNHTIKEFLAEQEKDKKKLEKLRQKWAFTLTTDRPACESQKVEQDMRTAVVRLFQQASQPLIEGSAYLEYTANGVPHVHGWYRIEGGGRIYAKQFKRVWSLWDENKKHGQGHQGGYHALMADNRYEGYAAAEGRKIISLP